MYRICIKKQTNEVVPDFQGIPSPGTLISNAVKAGLGQPEDFEEQIVDEDTYKNEVAKFLDKDKVSRENEIKRIRNKKKNLREKVKQKLELDEEELAFLIGD